jgi:hypothetical protein
LVSRKKVAVELDDFPYMMGFAVNKIDWNCDLVLLEKTHFQVNCRLTNQIERDRWMRSFSLAPNYVATVTKKLAENITYRTRKNAEVHCYVHHVHFKNRSEFRKHLKEEHS